METFKSSIEYSEIIKFIEDKYSIKTRDYAGSMRHFNDYQKLNDDPVNPNGVDCNGFELGFNSKYTIIRNGIRVPLDELESLEYVDSLYLHFERYKNWCKSNPCPPRLDYWYWLLANHFCDVTNPCNRIWRLKEILDDDDTPNWVKKITQLVYDEFGEYCNKFGILNVLIRW